MIQTIKLCHSSTDKCKPLIIVYYKRYNSFSLARKEFGSFVRKAMHKNFTKPKKSNHDTLKYGKRQCAL